MEWRPGASLVALQARAELLRAIRDFFHRHGVLEVETPLAARAAGTDPAIEPLRTRVLGPAAADPFEFYLQTSPEFAMKRLLAAGSGPIYQLCRAFRDAEYGRRHNPEFTLLEWYRPGYDQHRLMDEVGTLVRECLARSALREERVTYQDLFRHHLGIDPLEVRVEDLAAQARAAIPGLDDLDLHDRDGWLNLCMSHLIEPQLEHERLTFVHDYPASQAALARLNPADPRTAARFELYCGGLELANGFEELCDPVEQRARLEADNATRRCRGQVELPVDERFLAALQHGLPDAAGVALGVDRLLMVGLEVADIDQVLAFALGRV
jgi:lysyl-tRNA synthetase class 2